MKKYGLIGYPLTHSFSEKFFADKFSREKLSEVSYTNFPVSDISMLPSLISDPELEGFNVTIPYKEKILPFLDGIDPVAREIGAVNTVRVTRDNKRPLLVGYNTDAIAFAITLHAFLPVLPPSALVLGTGGASKAVVYSLQKSGIRVKLVSRTPEAGRYTYNDLNGEVMGENLLIVNTTPLGTYPDTESRPPIPYHLLTERHCLYDLVYNPPETGFMLSGKEYGARTLNGYGMLVAQAEAAWKIWNT
ncbi:MAG: shikimate dehydrogenase family protein [Bacteroidota bacterium]